MEEKKNQTMKTWLDNFTKDTFGMTRSHAIEHRICITCNSSVTGFRDELSLKEFGISAMCQTCQDSVFNNK
ncbi:MAG: hypothetical protein CMB80_02835 [Flammeovirgaceae bacterium]|nr:hypothetical protein [Flammeovirgaceae bacterium]